MPSFMPTCMPTFMPTLMSTLMSTFMRTSHGACFQDCISFAQGFLKNLVDGKAYPDCGSDDTQAFRPFFEKKHPLLRVRRTG